MFNTNTQKGVSLYLTIVILSVLITTLLTLVAISVSQIKIIYALGHSVTAFYAADTGIEQALYRVRKQGNFDNIPETPLGEAIYSVVITTSTEETIMESKGVFRNTRRAIEVRY